jgi:adenine-specific DNA-methyltransferase
MMEKMKMHSPNLTQDNIVRIREMFPGCVTEALSESGNVKLAVDFDQLRQELSESIVEGPLERYHLTWPGKREALLTANAPIAKALRPCREESVDFDTTKNLFIEGDNLDALKLLQETYLGKIKMIYIDPPYNTGNDFIYEDDFAEDCEEFLKRSNQKDEEGNRLVANTESNGRFHSDWLSMMYPRLKLARNLLSDDGVIFISIDDREQENLKKLCHEILGETNFIANIIWERAYSPVNLKKHFSENHDFVLCYAKNIDNTVNRGLQRGDDANQRYCNPDNDPRGDWKSSDLSVGPIVLEKVYEITTPSGRKVLPPNGYCWRLSEERFHEFKRDNRIWFGNEGSAVPSIKRFLSEVKDTITPMTIWKYADVGHSQDAKQRLKKLFEEKAYFDYPKPVGLIYRCCELYTQDFDIILDFFAGAATTAHAVMQLNAEHGGNRKFIMVQLPEPCDEKSEAFKAGYKTIAEISRERIRRAGKKILEGECQAGWNQDIGFRVLKVDSSNMEDVYYNPDAIDQDLVSQMTDNIKPDRTPEDLLFQVLLDWGVDLTLPIRKERIQGKSVFFVDENALVACFDTKVNEELVKELAKYKPLRVVFRDSGFVSDAVKINVEQIFKQMSPGTEVKSI